MNSAALHFGDMGLSKHALSPPPKLCLSELAHRGSFSKVPEEAFSLRFPLVMDLPPPFEG